MKTNVSLIIPCYNEAKNLPFLIRRCEKLIEEFPMEIIFVDNGSKDETAKIIEKNPFIKLIRIDNNEGYGNGILEGLRNANGEILAWTHADLQTDPNDMVEGLKHFRNSDDQEMIFVKGNFAHYTFRHDFSKNMRSLAGTGTIYILLAYPNSSE